MQGPDRNREVRSNSAEQYRDRMFELSASNPNVSCGSFRVFQRVLGLYYRYLVGDSGFVLDLVVSQSFPKRDDRIVEKLLQCVLPADLEVKSGEGSRLGYSRVLRVTAA